MELNNKSLSDRNWWQEKGYEMPNFSRVALAEKTQKEPKWVHFGCGNIFKAFIANVSQNLINNNLEDTGIIAIVDNIKEVNEEIYDKHDNLVVSVTLNHTGNFEKVVIGSITHCIPNENKLEIKEIFLKPSLQMVSFTITEKGYKVKDETGKYLGFVAADFEKEPSKAESFMGKIAYYLYERYLANKQPIAMVSMDNCAHNGIILKEAIECFAKHWLGNGFVPQGFYDYITSNKVSFPCSMIDKITPRPDKKIVELLESDGIKNMDIISRNDGVYIAPFVNAEKTEYLVIEDDFPNGRPKLEKGGVYLTDIETVNKVEKMKVTTCLNPLHTALAIFGCLLSYNTIADEMKDDNLVKLVCNIGYNEGLKVVVNPGIIDPEKFINEVINERFVNPFLPDTPQRIACDTSQKIPIRFGETIKSYKSHNLDVLSLTFIPLTIAGWFRYLLGKDDELNNMELNPDPMIDTLVPKLKNIKVGDKNSYNGELKPLLEDEKLFGVNLVSVGLSDKIEDMFVQMLAGKNAVRETLKFYLK